MLKYFLRSPYWLTRARSSPVGSYLDGFATTLREIGYCKRIGTGCIAYAVHLGLWAAAEGLRIEDLDEAGVGAFLRHLSRCHCPGSHAGLHAAGRHRTQVFVRYLRTMGVVALPGAAGGGNAGPGDGVLRVDAAPARRYGYYPSPLQARRHSTLGIPRGRPRSLRGGRASSGGARSSRWTWRRNREASCDRRTSIPALPRSGGAVPTRS